MSAPSHPRQHDRSERTPRSRLACDAADAVIWRNDSRFERAFAPPSPRAALAQAPLLPPLLLRVLPAPPLLCLTPAPPRLPLGCPSAAPPPLDLHLSGGSDACPTEGTTRTSRNPAALGRCRCAMPFATSNWESGGRARLHLFCPSARSCSRVFSRAPARSWARGAPPARPRPRGRRRAGEPPCARSGA